MPEFRLRRTRAALSMTRLEDFKQNDPHLISTLAYRLSSAGAASSRFTALHAPSPPAAQIKFGSTGSLERPWYGSTEMHRHPASLSVTFLRIYSDDTDFTSACCELIGWLSSE